MLKYKSEYLFSGCERKLRASLDTVIHPRLEKLSEDSDKLTPLTSFGTLTIDGPWQPEGIYVVMTFNELEEGVQRVSFHAAMRKEHYFIMAVMALVLILDRATAQTHTSMAILIWWGLIHLLLGSFYRAQEKSLVRELTAKLNMTKSMRLK
jgi:hypothetical protein